MAIASLRSTDFAEFLGASTASQPWMKTRIEAAIFRQRIANMHVLCYCDRPRVEDGVLVVQPLGIPSYVVQPELASAVGSHTHINTP